MAINFSKEQVINRLLFENPWWQSNKIDPVKSFEKELTKPAQEKFKKNCPFNFTDVYVAGSSYYESFKILNNSGSNLMFNLNQENTKFIELKLKDYKRIDNKQIQIQDYKIFYPHKDRMIMISDVTNDWNEIIGEVDLKNEEIEIYLIEEGKLSSAFKKEKATDKPYNYTCGIYFFKKLNKLIYWFLIEKE